MNVYLPSSPQGDVLHLFQSILDDIFSIVTSLSYDLLIFGGDINCNPTEPSPASKNLVTSLNALGAKHCNFPPNTYTYVNTQGHFSCIDHFFTMCNNVNKCTIKFINTIDNYMNFSDHIPVHLSLCGDFDILCNLLSDVNAEAVDGLPAPINTLNWEKADLNYFYDKSRCLLAPILESLGCYEKAMSVGGMPTVSCRSLAAEMFVDTTYENILTALHNAATASVPYHRKKCSSKFWWNEEMKELKKNAHSTHLTWVTAGKPRSGPIFQNRNKAKYKYRLQIKENKANEKLVVTNKLQDKLCKKIQNNSGRHGKKNLK